MVVSHSSSKRCGYSYDLVAITNDLFAIPYDLLVIPYDLLLTT